MCVCVYMHMCIHIYISIYYIRVIMCFRAPKKMGRCPLDLPTTPPPPPHRKKEEEKKREKRKEKKEDKEKRRPPRVSTARRSLRADGAPGEAAQQHRLVAHAPHRPRSRKGALCVRPNEETLYAAIEALEWYPYLCLKVCVCGHHFQQTGHQPGMVANPACGQLDRENGFFPAPFAPESLVSRDRFSRPVPRLPAHSPHPG